MIPENQYAPSPLLRTSALKALMILLIVTFGAAIVVSSITSLVFPTPLTTRFIRVMAILQDVAVFVLPAIVMAILVSPAPGLLLEIERKPSLSWVIAGIFIMLFANPAMNFIIELNENITLPASMGEFEKMMRSYEESASASVTLLMGGSSISDLIMGILIIGILAGFSEEIFFRGAIQGCLMQSRMNKHLAVWVTAIIFSLFHFQFFGFFPRVILGAFFGYLTWWTGSIWVSSIIHAFNNTIIVIAAWLVRAGLTDTNPTTDEGSSVPLIIGSIILTVGAIYASLKYLPIYKETGRTE